MCYPFAKKIWRESNLFNTVHTINTVIFYIFSHAPVLSDNEWYNNAYSRRTRLNSM